MNTNVTTDTYFKLDKIIYYMNDEQLAAFDDLIKLHERQRSLEYRLHYMENELEKMLDTKRRLDETLEYGERVLDLVEETIRKLDEQEAAES